MKREDIDEVAEGLFEGLAPPAPPRGLRSPVLAAAGEKAAANPTADVWTRIWENRWLRIIWATSVAALMVGHVVIVPRRSSPSMVTAEAQVDEAMADFLHSVRIAESASPNLGRAGQDRHEFVELDDGGNGS